MGTVKFVSVLFRCRNTIRKTCKAFFLEADVLEHEIAVLRLLEDYQDLSIYLFIYLEAGWMLQ